MIKNSSEWVSNAHPDRLADLIASKIIQDIQHKDGINSHAAVEVFLLHDSVIVTGEVTTTLDITDVYLRQVVTECFDRAGYISEMRKFWSVDEVVLPQDLKIENRLFKQSPDIALATTSKGKDTGYNDQGIYYSTSCDATMSHLGAPHFIATLIGESLALSSRKLIKREDAVDRIGPDIKVVVTTLSDEESASYHEVTAITIAVPHSSKTSVEDVRKHVKHFVTDLLDDWNIKVAYDCKWVINGTGRFVVHGQVSDTSMTGRKLAVNMPSAAPFYMSKMCGGGSLVKCAHASDLILPLACRFIANVVVEAGLSSYALVAASCAIGQSNLQSIAIKGDKNFDGLSEKVSEFFLKEFQWSPYNITKLFGFFTDKFDFSKVVEHNFFGKSDVHPWDSEELIKPYVEKLRAIL
jgi:S-adenosylmethionine synthetase